MSEWKTYKLCEVANLSTGFPFDGHKYAKEGQRVVRGDNVTIGALRWDTDKDKRWNEPFARAEEFSLREGDIVIGMDGSRVGRNRAQIKADDLPLLLAQRVACVRHNEKSLQKFLYYQIFSKNFENYIKSVHTGTSIPHVSLKQIGDFSFQVPDLSTQRRIAGILGSLDDKIELNRRINANLEAQAQALFRSWFVDFEPFRDGPFVDSELGKIPASLKIEHIGNIPHKIESGKRPKGGASEHGIPSIGAENIKGLGIYDYAKTKFIPEDFASTMKKGKINGYELLIYKDGGKPGYFIPNFTIFGEGFPYKEMYINEHVFCLDFFDKGFNTFAYFYMRTPYIMNQLNTIGGKAAIPGINTKDIESLPIFTNENEKVKEFGTLFLPTIKTILQNCVENKTLSALRDTLLPKLMAGEISC